MIPQFQIHLCTFEFQVDSQKYEIDFKGSCFARDATCSHQCCPSSTDYHSMFVSEVLVGDFVQGNHDYYCLPTRPEISNRLLDSFADEKILPSLSSLRSTRLTWHISWRIHIHPDKDDVRVEKEVKEVDFDHYWGMNTCWACIDGTAGSSVFIGRGFGI